MPVISLFFGIRVTMYYDDQNHRISMQNIMEIEHW